MSTSPHTPEPTADDYRHAVAAQLRADRKRTQLLIEDLADDTGLSKSSVMSYLNAKRDMPMKALVKICASLGVRPETVFAKARASVHAEFERRAA